jgi:hypothetical protein
MSKKEQKNKSVLTKKEKYAIIPEQNTPKGEKKKKF